MKDNKIKNEFIELRTLREKCYMNKKSRLECYDELLEKVKYELQMRDFSEISTDRLITIMDNLENKLNNDLENTHRYLLRVNEN